MRSLDIAATGVQAQQLFVDVISQNLSNINTTGYKLQRPEFQDLLYQDLRRVGANSSDSGTIVPTGIQLGLGVKVGSIYRNTNAGALQNTQGTLDLAIQGRGYFQVQLPSGEIAYTRSGTFQLSATGELVTADGFALQPTITIPQNATAISIDKSGEVFVTITGQVAPQNVGQLQLANFLNEGGLQATGDNLYLQTPASGAPITGIANTEGFGAILQGFLESSNVDPVTEITNLIRAQRAYEFNTQVISKSDQMMQTLNQVQ
ncbi:MAG: flagellar basal-body rod protein FlgG [Alphaproteobacteria bacterium]|nr:flagellar basal-body rod protein FlgG [Alphaproteobacteria bacterium]